MKLMSTHEVAKKIGCNPTKVLLWIASGDLEAINLAVKSDGARPRWKVSEEALSAFFAKRSSVRV